MQLSFPLPNAKIGKSLGIDASRGICDYTSAICAREAERLGRTVRIVEINVMSPTLNGKILHRVAVIDGKFILDQPQTELLAYGKGDSWISVCATMSYCISPGFESLKMPLQGENISPEWLFKPKGTVIPDEYNKNDGFDVMLIKSLLGAVENVKSTGGKYPIYTGIYNWMEVRYDSNSGAFEYIPNRILKWVVDKFTPRLIPITPKDINKAYGVKSGKTLCNSVRKQLNRKRKE